MSSQLNTFLNVHDVELEFFERGSGDPVLFLHGPVGVDPDEPYIDMLAEQFRVLVPSHPGFGASPEHRGFNSVHDLTYLYLDLLDELDLHDVTVIGSSVGGWIAAEMAIRSQQRIGKLVLVDPVGIKVGDRTTRDIADLYVLHPDDVRALTYHDPSFAPDVGSMSGEQVRRWVGNQEAVALYFWEPFMYNPKLRRLLRRITVPTLVVWGRNDGIVKLDYGEAYQQAIPGALMCVIDDAGHYPYIEQPRAFVARVLDFLQGAH